MPRTFDYLFGGAAGLFWPGLIASLALAVAAGALSPLVVVRRLAFVGQGVSHACFAGIGLALVVTWATGGVVSGSVLSLVLLVITGIAAGGLIGALSSAGPASRPAAHGADTAIGIVMVAGMALGFLLLDIAAEPVGRIDGQRPPEPEGVLFGSVLSVGWPGATLSVFIAACVVLAAWWHRRAIAFWAVDEEGASSFGVRTDRVRWLVLLLLSLLVVVAVQVAGVVLATAVLVLPGASALRLSVGSARVLSLSVIASVAAVVGGMVMAYEFDWPPGPSVVLAGVALWVATLVAGSRG